MRTPKSPSGYRIGIINPLTLVGTEIRSIMRERGFPYGKLELLDSSGQATGALTEMAGEPMVVASVSQEGLDDLDLVFFCGPPATNKDWIERHTEDGFIAIDVSQPSLAEDGTLVVADLNIDAADGSSVLISPHPIAIPMALILHQIGTLSAVETCVATVIQPASEFEQAGVEELARQTVSVLNVDSVPKEVFDRQVAFNLYPAASGNEPFIVSQIQALTTTDLALSLFVTQGTIFHSHTFSMFVKTRKPLDQEAIVEALAANAAFAFAEGDQQFGTIDAAGRDEVLIAEVRPDPVIRNGVWVWAVCDNLRRASALNAVLAAERALSVTPS
ncbi:MAG TPA: Asd/ArgC dimerization domain-containing protein [Thermoanaerobaculia bacterium]